MKRMVIREYHHSKKKKPKCQDSLWTFGSNKFKVTVHCNGCQNSKTTYFYRLNIDIIGTDPTDKIDEPPRDNRGIQVGDSICIRTAPDCFRTGKVKALEVGGRKLYVHHKEANTHSIVEKSNVKVTKEVTQEEVNHNRMLEARTVSLDDMVHTYGWVDHITIFRLTLVNERACWLAELIDLTED